MTGLNLNIPENYNIQNPYLIIDLPSEEMAKKLMTRTVLVKSVYELWADGPSLKDLCQKLHALPKSFTQNYTDVDSSFRIIVECFNKQLQHTEKIKKIEGLLEDGLIFGKINLNSPDNSFHLLEFYEETQTCQCAEQPLHVYFGRWLAEGQRKNLALYDLRKRNFIGNTSMDAGLSLVMANQACVKKGQFVFDPFVGTGSLLVAAAHHGAYVMGTDIDHNLLHGIGRASRAGQKWRAKDENIRSNLRQYGLEHLYIDALVADSSKSEMFRISSMFDAIITDPPYGIREPTKKVGTNQQNTSAVSQEREVDESQPRGNNSKKAQTIQYHISEVYKDLLNFAAKYLKLGGKLVYWVPVFRSEYREDSIPIHSCLNITNNSEQPFNTKVSRRLITMEKVLQTQDEAILNSARLEYDPFENGTFRRKYFLSQDMLYMGGANTSKETEKFMPNKVKKKLMKKNKRNLMDIKTDENSIKTNCSEGSNKCESESEFKNPLHSENDGGSSANVTSLNNTTGSEKNCDRVSEQSDKKTALENS